MHPTSALALTIFALALSAPARAERPREVGAGEVVLALTGLVVDLPSPGGEDASWALSGTWSWVFGVTWVGYEGRDVLDLRRGGAVVSRTHVEVRWDWDCEAKGTGLALSKTWSTSRQLWGRNWQVRGGLHTLPRRLVLVREGQVPPVDPFDPSGRAASAVSLCLVASEGPTILIDHLTFGTPERDEAAALAELTRVELLARLTRSFTRGRHGDASPTRRPEIALRSHDGAPGAGSAARATTLRRSQLELTLPEDGAIWLERDEPQAEGAWLDALDRVAPALPERSVVVGRVRAASCAEVGAQIEPRPSRASAAPNGVPTGWEWLGAVADGPARGHALCRPVGEWLLLVWAFVGEARAPRDLAPFGPLLEALAAARPRTP